MQVPAAPEAAIWSGMTSMRVHHRRIPSLAGAQEMFGVVDETTVPVEQDPSGRYIRYPILLGRGACKRVFRAFDCEFGKEVAWNQVEVMAMDMAESSRKELFAEIQLLQQLKHKNIMGFEAYWYNPKLKTINFITEMFMSGTLRQYRKKLRVMTESVLKRWAWQILEGLVYLHGHIPPIVHRDLKCDNIFCNGNTGQIKIGDLGLATAQQGLSIVGTPEFLAPEIYDEVYDVKVDVYSFGMVLLELSTLEYPYSECHGVAQIFRKVTQGIKPLALQRVLSPQLRELIETCIAHDPRDRPEARELLKHPFFSQLRHPPQGVPGLANPSAAPASDAKASAGHSSPISLFLLPDSHGETCSSNGSGARPGADAGNQAAQAEQQQQPAATTPQNGRQRWLVGSHSARVPNGVEAVPSPPGPASQQLTSKAVQRMLVISRALDRQDRHNHSVSIGELAQQLHKHDGRGSAAGDDEDALSDSSEEVIIPFHCLLGAGDDPAAQQYAGHDRRYALDDMGPLPAATPGTSAASPARSRSRSHMHLSHSWGNSRRPSGAGLSPSSSMACPCTDGQVVRHDADGAEADAFYGRASSARSSEFRIRRTPMAMLKFASSRMSSPRLEGRSSGVSNARSEGQAHISPRDSAGTPCAQQRSSTSSGAEDLNSISPANFLSRSAGGQTHRLLQTLSTERPFRSQRHQGDIDEVPADMDSGAVNRPIYGIIVRVKQCKGFGFTPNQQRDRLRRSTTM